VLGLSAIDAGLTIAAQPLASFVTSGIVAGLSQKVNGKYLLIAGLLLFAFGMAYMDWAAQAISSRWVFLLGLIATGIGNGLIWMPALSIATRDLRADLAGVASGVLNTIQELGGVIASAVVGAFLQNRLALALHDRAVASAGRVPAEFRGRFIDAFNQAAHHGLQVGAGQSGTSLQLPAAVQEIARYVFAHAFVDAMHPTLVLPLAMIVLAAAATTAVRTRRRPEVAESQRRTAVGVEGSIGIAASDPGSR
jgi:hypothetical protein